MKDQTGSEQPSARYVGVGVGTYDDSAFKPLPQAITEAQDVAELLKAFRYEVHVIKDPDSANGPAGLKAVLPKDLLGRGGSLIVLWSGHGEPTPEGKLHLVPTDGAPGETPLISAEYLAGLASRTGASQILLIFDTCYSGTGAVPAVDVADRVVRELPPNAKRVWIGVLASAMEFERAKDGVFGTRLLKLLREGPVNPELRFRWSAHSAGIRGDDLIDALIKEWDISDQKPKPAAVGDPWIMLPNPNYDPDAPERVVEHLLLAARGVEPGEEGFYFTGRAAQLYRIVSWLQAGRPGIFFITGPAGCGKSAIVGRIVSLSNPEERKQLLAQAPLEHVDPGEGSVHAHVHARGVTAERFCQLIDEQLVRKGILQNNPSGPRNKWELFGAIERVQTHLVLIIDGLDESGSEAWRIAEDVIRLLAKRCLVLVSTREIPPQEEGGPSLIQALGQTETIDLGEAPIQAETQREVRDYIEKRLIPASGAMDPSKITEAVIRIAHEQMEGLYLLARVITAQLRTEPVDTALPGWEVHLDRSMVAAFERELERIPSLRRDDQELPQAARELLTALAWSYGSGLTDDIWPIVAMAISGTGVAYQRGDVFWLLAQAGRYVIEAGEDGRAVYRLAHQRLVEYLHPKLVTMDVRALEEETAARIAPALVEQYLQLLESGRTPQDQPYLWNYVWRHCVDAGEQGVAALRNLVHRAPDAFLPDLAAALNNLGIRYSEVGKRQEAVAPTEEAVRIRRELAQTNPAFLPNLAAALNNLGVRYSEVGKRQEAVAPTEEAVRSYRELAQTNPAFLPDLAEALDSLCSHYDDVRREQEASQIRRELAKLRRSLDV